MLLFLFFFSVLTPRSVFASGMGHRILKEGQSLSKQLNEKNTIYVVKYDFNIGSKEKLMMPANCILEFEGGSFSNGTIVGNNTIIKADPVRIFSLSTDLEGTWNINMWYPEWYGAVGDGVTDDTEPLQILNGKCILLSNKTYLCSNLVFNSYTCITGVNKFKSCLKQKNQSKGDFIRLENWFGGTISDIRIEGGNNIVADTSLWMQSLLKIVNYTYKHNPDAPGEYDCQDVSTYYSTVNNVVIRNSNYSGLSVIGTGHSDKGQMTEHNWIHKISNLWVERCADYGIYDNATDNQWSNINVSRCGLTNLYISGSSELYSNVKLDGESGYRLDGQSSTDILNNRYNGAGLVLIDGNNIITGLDIQSIKYKGIVLDASTNLIIGTINNIGIGFRKSKEDQRNCPAVYLYGQNLVESNTLILNVFDFSDEVGTCVIRHAPDMSKIYNNNFYITYRPYNSDYNSIFYKNYIADMIELSKNRNIIQYPFGKENGKNIRK